MIRKAIVLAPLLVLLPVILACCEGGGESPPPPPPPPPVVPPPPPPPQYEIKMHRPSKVGDAFHLKVHVTENKREARHRGDRGTKTETTARQLDFLAKAKVLSVDSVGNPSATEYTIEQFVAQSEGKSKVLLDPGRILTIKNGDPAVLTLDRGKLSKSVKRDVRDVVDTKLFEGQTDDDAFGVKGAQKIGASWPVNAAVISQLMSDSEGTMPPDGISGMVTLAGVEPCGAGQCLKLGVRIKVTQIVFPSMPSFISFDKVLFDIDMQGLLPTDGVKQAPRRTEKMSLQVGTVAKLGSRQERSDMTMEQTKEQTRTPLP